MTAQTGQKVWHITNYLKLFVATDAAGRVIGKVAYSQRPIYGTNEHTERYKQRMAALEQLLRPDQYIWSKHVFEELLDQSQMHHYGDKHLRGYIVDEQHKPADSKRIAAFLKLDKKTTERYLSYLAKVGLIELIALPSEEQMRSDVESCGHSSTSPSRTGKREIERVTGTGKDKNKYPGTGKGEKKKNPNPNGQGELDLQGQVGQLVNEPKPEPEPDVDGKASTPPPTTQTGNNPNPTDPTKPDGGTPEASHDAHAGHTRFDDISLARDCLGFAQEVYRRLGIKPTAKNPMSAEIESWSNAWRRAMAANASTPWLLALRAKTLKRADKLRNRHGPGNKTAILMSEFNKRILAGKAA